jgi:hypothetical protein
MVIFTRESSIMKGKCTVMASYIPREKLGITAISKMINLMAMALSTILLIFLYR